MSHLFFRTYTKLLLYTFKTKNICLKETTSFDWFEIIPHTSLSCLTFFGSLDSWLGGFGCAPRWCCISQAVKRIRISFLSWQCRQIPNSNYTTICTRYELKLIVTKHCIFYLCIGNSNHGGLFSIMGILFSSIYHFCFTLLNKYLHSLQYILEIFWKKYLYTSLRAVSTQMLLLWQRMKVSLFQMYTFFYCLMWQL